MISSRLRRKNLPWATREVKPLDCRTNLSSGFHLEKGQDERGKLQSVALYNTFLVAEIRQAHPDIPWGNIIKMREIFAHHYGDLNYDIVWETSCLDVPALADKVRMILEVED